MVFQNLFNQAKSATKKTPVEAGSEVSSPTADKVRNNSTKTESESTKTSKQEKAGSRKRKLKPSTAKQNQIDTSLSHENKSNKKHRRTPVSQEAINLTNELKHLSQQKKLDQAISLYRESKYNNVRDSYHACLLIDCCSRCGDVLSAEKVLKELRSNDLNTEIYTALMKGYVHGGKINKAIQLFRKMTKKNVPEHQRANVRTLNTILRGCLWTAAMVKSSNGQEIETVNGGVVTSEEAWNLYRNQQSSTSNPDASSYEYCISLLCQSLRTDEAKCRIDEFQTNHNVTTKGKATIVCSDHSILETLAVSYLALGKAFALLGNSEEMWTATQRSLSAIRCARNLLNKETSSVKDNRRDSSKSENISVGGKQAWKNKSESDANSSRVMSNVAYRSHRLSELETDAIEVLKVRSNVDTLCALTLVRRLTTNLIYFSGGGTTELSDEVPDDTCSEPYRDYSTLKSSWFSFGLQKLANLKNAQVAEKSEATNISFDVIDVINRIFKTSLKNPVDSTGKLNCETIFSDNSRPLDIEIGSGFGDWIVKQAEANPLRNYIGVELRADRVYQSFIRSTLFKTNKPLDNICLVGGDSLDFLCRRVKENSVSTVYANHPEPPTQTFGDDQSALDSVVSGVGKEPAHMLHSKTIHSIAKSLKKRGRIVVVTDSRSYARLVAATFSRVIQQNRSLLRSVKLKELGSSHLHLIETFNGNVCLYQGQPNAAIGHSNDKDPNGSSYFDRLWRTGAGRHSERSIRFVIVMCRQG